MTITHTRDEVCATIGARTVSWRPGAVRGDNAEAASFALDVARAVAAATVEAMLALLDPDLAPCDLPDTAELEAARADHDLVTAAHWRWHRLHGAVDRRRAQASAMGDPGHPRAWDLRAAALTYAATFARCRAVRW